MSHQLLSSRVPEVVFEETLNSFLSPIGELLKDASVSEILINGPHVVYYERKGKLHRADFQFGTSEELDGLCQNLAQYVGKSISPERPILEGRLPDGSRVSVVSPPAARGGQMVSIRRFSKERLRPEQLIEFQSITQEALDFLRACLLCKRNVVIAGGTGSGKTTLLNILSSFFPPNERIIVMEDVCELQVQCEHVVYLETRPADGQGKGEISMRDLLRAVLRMRPDRIIVGEIRGGEAMELVQALSTGHGGSMTTLHANYAIDALHRLETMCLMSDLNMPLGPLRSQVVSAIDIVVQQNRLRDGTRRVVGIYEAEGLNHNGEYVMRPLFEFKDLGETPGTGRIQGHLLASSRAPTFADDLRARGFVLPMCMQKDR